MMMRYLTRFLLSLALFTSATSLVAQDTVNFVRINGQVITSEGSPVANHSVEITGQDSTSPAFWTLFSGTNDDGRFSLNFPLADEDGGGTLHLETEGFFNELHDTLLTYFPDTTQSFNVLFVLPTNPQSYECSASWVYAYDLYNEQKIHFNNISENYTHVYWDFGDGNASTTDDPVHIFEAGIYTVCLTVYDSINLCSDEYCATIAIETSGNCSSNFDYFMLEDRIVEFEAIVQNPEHTKFYWSFGDGDVDTSAIVSHQYAFSGEYEVTLTTVDPQYCMHSVTRTLIVKDNIECHAGFAVQQDDSLYQRFTFSDTSSGDISERRWYIDEQEFGSDSLFTIILAPGEHQVCMATYDTLTGCHDSLCREVISPHYNCSADFDMDILSMHVDFNAYSNSHFPVTYQWDFGDGNVAEGPFVSHLYETEGTYAVKLTTTDSLGCQSEIEKEIKVSQSGDCIADFIWEASEANPYQISFINHSTGTFDSTSWDFGDGNFSFEDDPAHQYAEMGVYPVCLTIYNTASGCEDTKCLEIEVPEDYCQAGFTFQADSLFVVFEAVSGSGYPVVYNWEYGDGQTGEGKDVSHLYDMGGSYNVRLTAEDSLGCISVAEKTIELPGADICTALFEYTCDSLDNIYNVQFTNLSVGAYENVFWEFGDGNSSTADNPGHVYNQPGDYSVCLTISSDYFCEDKYCLNIHIPEYIPPVSYNIAGQVFAGFFPASDASVFLIRKIENDYYTVDTAEVNEDGIYYFYQAHGGEYLLRARPHNIFAEDYVSAYYDDDFTWDDAELLLLNQDVFQADIALLNKNSVLNGSGIIKGEVVHTGDFKVQPATGIEIFLLNDTYQAMDGEISIEDGTFQFQDIPPGAYWIYAEVPGKKTHPLYTVLEEGDMVQDNIQIAIKSEEVTYRINELETLPVFKCWPNPVQENLNVSLNETGKGLSVHMAIYSATGRLVSEFELPATSAILNIPVHNLSQGLYSFVISTNSGMLGKGVFIKK